MGYRRKKKQKHPLRESAERRSTALAGIALLAGSFLAYACLFTDSVTNRVLGHPTLFKDFCALICGGVIGVISSAVIVPVCYGKNLRIALPIVYGVSLVVVVMVTVSWNPSRNPFLVVVIGVVVLVCTCIGVMLGLPRTIQRFVPGKCGWCGYNITGGESISCPECGQNCDPDTMTLAANTQGPVLGEMRLRDYWMQTWSRRGFIIAAIVLALVIGSSRYLLPHFSPDRFYQVRQGMSLQEVKSILGRPDRQSVSTATNEQVWTYEQGGIALGHCLIGFTDGHVTNKEIYGW